MSPLPDNVPNRHALLSLKNRLLCLKSYCTVIVNDLFTWFGSTGSKSRENFLSLLHRPWKVYVLNQDALDYLELHGFSKKWRKTLAQYLDVYFLNRESWVAFMKDIGLDGSRLQQKASEGVLYGSLLHHGFNRQTVTFIPVVFRDATRRQVSEAP